MSRDALDRWGLALLAVGGVMAAHHALARAAGVPSDALTLIALGLLIRLPRPPRARR